MDSFKATKTRSPRADNCSNCGQFLAYRAAVRIEQDRMTFELCADCASILGYTK